MAARKRAAWPAPQVRKGEPWTLHQVANYLGRSAASLSTESYDPGTSFPKAAGIARRPGGTKPQRYWWSADIERYRKARLWPAPHPLKGSALTAAEVGDMLGLARSTVLVYCHQPPPVAGFPAPAGRAHAPSGQGVRLFLYWWWADVDGYRRQRASAAAPGRRH